MSTIFAGLVTLIMLIIMVVKKLNHWRFTTKFGAKLPPGSLGWPYIGETLQLFSQNPHLFFSSRQKRYGDVFKTRILGCPCIMLANPEALKFVLMTKANLFKPTYPKSKERLIGTNAIFFRQGTYHSQIRKLVQASLSLDTIKPRIPKIELIAKSTLNSWADGRVVHVFQELKKFTFDVAVLSIFGELDSYYHQVLKENYVTLDKGYNSFPTIIPATCYFKSLMARRRLSQIIRDILNDRREKRLTTRDLLGCLLNFNENGKTLTDDQIIDNVIGVLFAAQDTAASVLTWILKYITDHPKLLEEIQREQMTIYKANANGEQPLTWTQIREMQVTHKVILESLRMASIISFTYREAIQDVVYDGYLIPKGWKVLPLFRNIHHNPAFFDDPETFNPSRFEAATIKAHTYMPFGYGAHACPGNEVAKLLMLVFIHHLVTHFRWEVVGPHSGVEYDPFPVPEQGLRTRFWRTS
ncbi:abscisic acid 8'-hydroxylase 4 [Beta vulgaris subsp. vulgaris]|uniref:abscisic acid 8'-hydroxylase 4 n=1 Tax=Beta vulgaris subsp. vulgaris TaxID=3555 RepID=UPI0020370D6A|nr:abscisic acid 8'-hydroxylase 4 [Beta vulgaris subsp. vulgaris]